MTEPKVERYHNAYHLGKMVGHPDGKWVKLSDYEALAARVEELEEKKAAVWRRYDNEVLENKRLREALEETPCNCDKTDPCWVKVCVRCSALKEKP